MNTLKLSDYGQLYPLRPLPDSSYEIMVKKSIFSLRVKKGVQSFLNTIFKAEEKIFNEKYKLWLNSNRQKNKPFHKALVVLN